MSRHFIRRDGQWVQVTPSEFAAHRASAPAPGKKPFGLGDAVAAIAQPIARTIDSIAGTKISECAGCKKRREALNRLTQ